MSKELEALRKIGLMTTKRNLQDFPIGNQPKQIVKMKIKEMPEFQEVVNALNELKRLKKFKETFDNYELAKKQDFIAYENWLECEAELKKLPTKLLDEVYANYILQLNARIKINKKIIEENFDLNPSLCHDLEVENTALEFALMLIEGKIK